MANQANNPNTAVDLDAFLGANQAAVGPQSNQVHARLPDPQSDRMLIALFMADDSGSIADRMLRDAVVQGLTLGMQTLRGIKGSDCYVIVEGFQRTYFEGMVVDVNTETGFDDFSPAGGTPLITASTRLFRRGLEIAEKYRAQGIPTTLAMLILTDGEPNSDEWNYIRDFKSLIGPQDYIVGMGVARGEDEEQRFVDCFKNMGLTRFVTPKDSPTAVRRAINQFSQSVASVAA